MCSLACVSWPKVRKCSGKKRAENLKNLLYFLFGGSSGSLCPLVPSGPHHWETLSENFKELSENTSQLSFIPSQTLFQE